ALESGARGGRARGREEYRLRRSDLISGSLIVLSGLVMIFVIVPVQINASSDYGLNPAFFPLLLLWLLVAMGALLVVSRLPQPADPPDSEPVLDRWNWLFITCTTVFLLAGFIAIQQLGFVVAGVVMIALLMFMIELRRLNWLEVMGVSVISPFVIYYLLYHLFSVQLPTGALFP
ncbi:MAG: tripartite tricarboxylate transporter TctB family protein, partial [Pseudolabrys sp.]